MRKLARLCPALVFGGLAVTLLAIPTVHYRTPRAIASLSPRLKADDSVVVRRSATLSLPGETVTATLVVSGPAQIIVAWSGGFQDAKLESGRSTLVLDSVQQGTLDLTADAPIRIHALDLTRIGRPSPVRIVIAVFFVIAGVVLASRRNTRWPVPVSVVVVLAPALVLLRGTLGGAQLATYARNWVPAIVCLALAASYLLVWALPKQTTTQKGAGPQDRLLPLAFGLLVLISCLAQVLSRPQPLLASDPAAYHDIGGRFSGVFGTIWTPDGLAAAVEQLRPFGGLWAIGLFYGILRALRDDPTTIYFAHAIAIAAAVAFMVRAALRLGGRREAIVTGILALAYPPLAVICGIVQPEPLILFLWALAFDLLLAGWSVHDRRRLGLAGLSFGLGLALHPQGLWYLLAGLVLLLLPFWSKLLLARARVAAFAIGLIPVVLTTFVGTAYARPKLHVLDRDYGFWAFTSDVPLGYWLFLDSDGWPGPLKLEGTRFVRGLRAAEQTGPVGGTPGQLAYTARFLGEDLEGSLSQLLRNAHRLFHQPDDPPARGWLLPYAAEVRWHRAMVVLFLLAAPVVWMRGGGVLYVPFLLLLATYPFYFAFNKYAIPAVLFVLLGAALSLVRLIEGRRALPAWALAAASIGAVVAPADLAGFGLSPSVARIFLLTLNGGGLALVFSWAGRSWASNGAERLVTLAAASCLLVPTAVAGWSDVSWKSFEVRLDQPAGYRMALGEEGVARLDRAREAFLLLDLRAPTGEVSGLRLTFDSGLILSGADLVPTMPGFGLATVRYHRAPATFPQWWRVAWRPEMAKDGRFGLTLSGAPSVRLRGELGVPTSGGDHRGLSLGEWPNLSVYRLMHDGEYRHPVVQHLEGGSRESRYNNRILAGTFGIRLVATEESGGASWETAPAPAREVVTAIWLGTPLGAGRADIETPSGVLRLDLNQPGHYRNDRVEAVVAHPKPETVVLVLKLPAEPGRPLRLGAFPRQELSAVVRSLDPKPRRTDPPMPSDWSKLPFVPVARILEYRPGRNWKPEVVF